MIATLHRSSRLSSLEFQSTRLQDKTISIYRPLYIKNIKSNIKSHYHLNILYTYYFISTYMGNYLQAWFINYINLFNLVLDESEASAGLFCDELSKSFGYVAHDIFLDKLRHYKFSFSRWFRLSITYWGSAAQHVIQNHVIFKLDWKQLLVIGLPWGSILGPILLFKFYLYQSFASRY